MTDTDTSGNEELENDSLEERARAQRKELTEERDWRSQHASDTARRLAMGVLALVWGLLAFDNGSNLAFSATDNRVLIASGIAALLSLAADWLQAIVGFYAIDIDYDRVVVHKKHDAAKDEAYTVSEWYRLTEYSFWAKQLLAPLAVVLLIYAIAPALLGERDSRGVDEPRGTRQQSVDAKQ